MTPRTAPKRPRTNALPVVGLITLSLIPVLAGAARVTSLASGAAVTDENARFFASPAPVIVHIIGATLFCILGALQFLPRLRMKRPSYHRFAGRIAAPAGLAAALAGLWMTLFYPWAPLDGFALYLMRLFFGTAMAASIIYGFVLIRRRDFTHHSEWMMRAYAIGIAAGTQVLTMVPYALIVGEPTVDAKAVLMLLAWVINLAVAEWVIRRARRRNTRPRTFDRGAPASARLS